MINPVFRIVLVEDNEADVYLFRQALASAGLDVALTVIDDGADAMAFAKSQAEYVGTERPDLVVLDLNLPKNAGLEVLEAIRQNPALSNIPVSVMSSSAAPREQSRIKELGVDLIITKPPDLDEFLRIGDLLKQVLMESKARRQSAAL